MPKTSLERVGIVDVKAKQSIVLYLGLVWFRLVQGVGRRV